MAVHSYVFDVKRQYGSYIIFPYGGAASSIASVSAKEHEETVAQQDMNFSDPSDTMHNAVTTERVSDSEKGNK